MATSKIQKPSGEVDKFEESVSQVGLAYTSKFSCTVSITTKYINILKLQWYYRLVLVCIIWVLGTRGDRKCEDRYSPNVKRTVYYRS